MAYIGRQLARGENKLFDDISSSFNGSTTTFTLAVSSVATATATPYQLFVSLGGVMQKPNTDFTTAGNQITFTTAPAAGLSCWIMMQGDTIDQAAIPDASVTPSKISGSNFAFSGDLRLKDADGSHYVGFASPSTVTTNKVWTLPAADGSNGDFLKTNGSAVLSWGSVDTSTLMPLSGGIFSGDVTFDGATAGYDIVWDKSDNALEWADNAKAKFGTGGDLEIFHNASNSVINDAGTGDLLLQVGGSTKATVSSTGFDITGALTVSTNATITGNLTVSGTTTTINTQTLDVEDKNVVIGKVSSPSDTTADGGGITLKGATDKTINWVNSTDAWTFSEHINIAAGKKLGVGGSNYGTSGQVLTSGGSGAAPSWASPSGSTFTAVANGAIANNKAVKIDTDGKVSEIKETLQNRSTPAGVVSAGQAFPINDANNTGGNIRANRKSTVVYDSDKGRIIIIWGGSGYLKCRVGTPNKTTGAVTWGNVISIDSSNNFKEMSAVYDTTADKVILFVCKDNSPARLEGYVGTVASSGNSVTWSSAVSPGNGEVRYSSSAFDSTTGRTIVCFQDVSSGGCKFEICYINSGTLTWHTGDTANSNMISTDMFGSATTTSMFDVCSVDSSKWLFCCTMESSSPPSGFTQYALYAKIINASTNTTAAPTYANAGAKHIETYSSTQRGTNPSVAWDPTLEKIMYTWEANSAGSETSSNSYGMLCYFNAGKTDITINDATYNVGGSGNTSNLHQLAYDGGSGRFMFTIEDYAGVRGSFLTCGGTGNNTLTVGGRGTVISPNPDNFGTQNKHDLIDIAGGYMFSFYGNQTAGSSATNKTITSIIATMASTTNLTDAEAYVGFADAAYTNGQTATIKTYGNNAETLTSLTAGTPYYVQGDGSIATTVDSSLSLGSNRPLAGMALSATKLLIRDPLAKA